MDPASHLLPAQPTPLVGRADELATIRQRLVGDGVRLLTLTGPAGVGKTRLALAAAAQLAEPSSTPFPDGVTLVDLAPIREPPLVLPAIARALGLTDTGQPPLAERLHAFLRERAHLLVLDNFEQILPAAAALADLLIGCPGLALLVTSRVPLALRWEQVLRVTPLAVPDLDGALPPLDALGQIPAVALFVERARARRADFALTAQQAPLVAQLVVQLDGLPLALELAAARLDVLALPTVARRLGDRLRLLRWEAADVPARQQSLEAAVGWSYDLLNDDERRLFRCLGVFVGRVSIDTLAAVVASAAGKGDAADEAHTLVGLVALAEKSLVLPLERQGGHEVQVGEEEPEDNAEPAFGMLETVREYAWEWLAAAGELAAARRAHAHAFLALAERAEPELRGRDQRAWFLRLEREHANLRAALRWLLDQHLPDEASEHQAGLRLAAALGWFWQMRGYHAEGWRWLEEALARVDRAPVGEEADAAVRTRALLAAGALLVLQGDFARARVLEEAALALARAQQQQDPALIARTLTYLGFCAVYAGDWAESVRTLREAQVCWEALGDPFFLGLTLEALGIAAVAHEDREEAAVLHEAALERLAAAGDLRDAGNVRLMLAVTLAERGDLSGALRHVRAALETSLALQDRWLLSFGARVVVAVVGAHADPTRRARLLGAADALSQTTDAASAWERSPILARVTQLQVLLAQGELGAAYRAGRGLPFGEVAGLAVTLLEEVAQALARHGAAPASAKQPQSSQHSEGNWSPLSTRELEVLRLVAQGLSNKAIGRQLFISASTVTYHLTSVFNKLGVDTRAQAVAVVVQRGLL